MNASADVNLLFDDLLPSAKFVVRVPKTLHRRLAEAAAEDDVSLNHYVATTLASAVGRKEER